MLRLTESEIVRMNIAKIMHFIKYENIRSRTALAQRMNLTRASITHLTARMIAQGMIYEKGIAQDSPTRGRNRVILEINDSFRLVIGVTLDRDRICCMLSTLNGQALDNEIHSTESMSYRDILSHIVSEVSRFLRNNCITSDIILGIGICVSYDAMHIIEGNDKLARIKKDLSHALNYKIIARSTIEGILLAHRTFAQSPILQGCIMAARYGKYIMSGYSLNGQTVRNGNGRGGFASMQLTDYSDTYRDYNTSLSNGDPIDIVNKLADDLHMCDLVLCLERVYVLGDFFSIEQNISDVNTIIASKYKRKNLIEASVVSDDAIACAGCAVIVNDFYGGVNFFNEMFKASLL